MLPRTETSPDPSPPANLPKARLKSSRLRGLLLGLLLVLLGAAGWSLWQNPDLMPVFAALQATPKFEITGLPPAVTQPALPTLTLSAPAATNTNLPAQLSEVFPTLGAAPTGFPGVEGSAVILSVTENGYSHLFAYRPSQEPLTRLTDGPWNDITPALSPDGRRLAFASNRAGAYDLYIMTLADGSLERLTDTPAWEGSPTWSPDSLWLAYEGYSGDGTGGLDIYILSLDNQSETIRLTDDLGADFSPVWSPQGRELAFVSTRSGNQDVWLARLDQVDQRFVNLSQTTNAAEAHPAWAPDGGRLAWSSRPYAGIQTLMVWNSAQPEISPSQAGSGDWPVWDPTGGAALLTFWQAPNQTYLTAFQLDRPGIVLPPLALPGSPTGLCWGMADLPTGLPGSLPPSMSQAAVVTPQPLWNTVLNSAEDIPNGRLQIIPLADVQGPNPSLQDRVDESFQALRLRVGQEVGWDFLSSLENAYIPLTAPLWPGQTNDWLYTGRAFSFNSAPQRAGWMLVVREDIGSEVYWRIFLRTRFQDGTQGQPLHALGWDLNARYSGDARNYEQGGAPDTQAPAGYWYDFTSLAATYGWERQPALITWRSNFGATRFNQYVFTGGRDWFSAMLEIYPKEALDTPTPIPPPTETPTPTPRPSRTPYQSPTPWPSRTPHPTETLRPTKTPTITPTLPPTDPGEAAVQP